ncbi:hypothetical protein ADIAL_2001 [Alkalibacterium sp. AK22]|uniref:competence type IV pilus major pilin ComGC n=1 Tax=Alkalibacterium sp. AK22 TaxID=1229520 RepID=UPI0004473F99|nr:prepilin-type N-terminal cleavage/methylation domain-containing protein [Alkalibacterium sp. AK22]EXJ22415.1 hypothetical protein ADIAL_2001 [Alkalibacterium sp. AK22]
MRNKIKQMMKKEEGFTLVELLAVIVILGLIVALAVPAIGNVITRANNETQAAESALIVDAARLYEIENGRIGSEGVTVEALINAEFLEVRDGDQPTGSVIRTNDGLSYTP